MSDCIPRNAVRRTLIQSKYERSGSTTRKSCHRPCTGSVARSTKRVKHRHKYLPFDNSTAPFSGRSPPGSRPENPALNRRGSLFRDGFDDGSGVRPGNRDVRSPGKRRRTPGRLAGASVRSTGNPSDLPQQVNAAFDSMTLGKTSSERDDVAALPNIAHDSTPRTVRLAELVQDGQRCRRANRYLRPVRSSFEPLHPGRRPSADNERGS